MPILRISGPMLTTNLERQGQDLAVDTDLIYANVSTRTVGVNTQNPDPTVDLHVLGAALVGNLLFSGNTISSNLGQVDLGDIGNVRVSGGNLYDIVYTDGAGNLSFANLDTLADRTLSGNFIPLGSNITGALVTNAVSLTTNTTVTDSIAELNYVLNKLIPLPPNPFPGPNPIITINGLGNSLRMCDDPQIDNTATGGHAVLPGTVITNVLRTNVYSTNTIANVGPGDAGTVTVYLNGSPAGSANLTGSSNGTYGNLIISQNQDYHNVFANVVAGFWSSFSAQATGRVQPGWNEVYIADTKTTSNTSTANWYYDASDPGIPAFANVHVINSSNVVTYSSTIPHYTNAAVFAFSANVSRLSGDMFPASNVFVTGTSGGAFIQPASVSYGQALGVPFPLTHNLYVTSGSAQFTTTANVISGFGSSTAGPTITVNNSYHQGTHVFSPGATVLYKTGVSNQIEETILPIAAEGAVGSSPGIPFRIVNPGNTDTPAYTGQEAPFDSKSGPLTTSDATVVASVLKFDQTNYSVGYLPVGPDLSGQASNAQYFTFKFNRSSISKFDIKYTGTVSGIWVAMPGSRTDQTSSLNGWLDLGTSYAGSGIPGSLTVGNGVDGCALGGIIPVNTPVTAGSYTATFGGVSSTDPITHITHDIYVRIKFSPGQSVTALSIEAATN
jgi:hypothetical protein